MRSILFACLLLAAPAAAQSITSVNGVAIPIVDPADIVKASVGTQLTIAGSGFLGLSGKSKPKVFIDSAIETKKRVLKIIEATDEQLIVEIKTGVPGDFDLTVQPKGKGVAALVAEDIVRMLPPTFDAPTPEVAAPNGIVTLTGTWGPETFGTKKGKVKVGGKVAKVQEWTKDTIIFLMPKKLADGLYAVEVSNKIGKTTVNEDSAEDAPFCLTMDGSTFDVGGEDRFSCRLNNTKYTAGPFLGVLTSYTGIPPYNLSIFGTIKSGNPSRSVVLTFQMNLAEATYPLVIHGSPSGDVTSTLTTFVDLFDFETTEWSTLNDGPDPDHWIVVLQSYDMNEETGGHQLVGSFAASCDRISGEANPVHLEITAGDFRATVEPAP